MKKTYLYLFLVLAFVISLSLIIGCAVPNEEAMKRDAALKPIQATPAQAPVQVSADAKKKAENLAKLGEAEMMKNQPNYQMAERLLRDALNQDPNSTAAKLGLERLQATQRRMKEKQAAEDLSIQKAKIDPQILLGMEITKAIEVWTEGNNTKDEKKKALAISMITEIVKSRNPNSSNTERAWFNLAAFHHYAQDFNKAIECYSNCLRVNPNNFEARFSMSLAYMDTGNCSDALKQLIACDELKPNQKKVYLKLGSVHSCLAGEHQKFSNQYISAASTMPE